MSTDPSGPDGPSRAARLRRNTRLVLITALVVVVVALVAGIVFSRADPRQAASLLLGDRVVTEPEGQVTTGEAPTSGDPSGPTTCGVTNDPLRPQEQVNALAAGTVVVQYRDPDDATPIAEALAHDLQHTVVAPNRELEAPIVATAWGRRLQLTRVDGALLRAFVTAHEGLGPQVAACTPPVGATTEGQ